MRNLLFYFLKLGTFGFGGPIALTGAMHRDLVEKKKFFSEEEYSEGFALSQLAPGPVATQLAMYLGWLRGGWLGATGVAMAFILPSFLMVVVLAELYRRYQNFHWIQSVFLGVGAAVIAVIIRSVSKLSRKVLLKDKACIFLGAFNFFSALYLDQPSALLFLATGLGLVLVRKQGSHSFRLWGPWPVVLAPLGAFAINSNLEKIFIYFFKAGAFVFGTGLAIIPFLHGAVVQEFRWLSEREFLDAVSVALITPGPAVITVAFIGYLVEGVGGAIAAALGVFLPVYLFVIALSPIYRKFLNRQSFRTFVEGVTIAAMGALLSAIVGLASRSLNSKLSFILFLLSGLCLIRFKKIPEPLLILGSGLVAYLVTLI